MEKMIDWWQSKRNIFKISLLCGASFIIIVTGLMVYLVFSSSQTQTFTVEDIELASEATSTPGETLTIDESPAEINTEIYIDIKGAVNNPGVYALPQGSRLFDALDMAGGLTTDAATEHLNQAQLLTDQMMIYVYNYAEMENNENTPETNLNIERTSEPANLTGPVVETQNSSLVNINTADITQLQTLPGIGPKKAEAIIMYRTESGSFDSVESLQEVSGIGAKTFEKLQSLVTVTDQ